MSTVALFVCILMLFCCFTTFSCTGRLRGMTHNVGDGGLFYELTEGYTESFFVGK
jgi:hypothetical protein